MKQKNTDRKIWREILNRTKVKSPTFLVKIDSDQYQIIITQGLN